MTLIWSDIKVALNSNTGDMPVQTKVAFKKKKKSYLYLIQKHMKRMQIQFDLTCAVHTAGHTGGK